MSTSAEQSPPFFTALRARLRFAEGGLALVVVVLAGLLTLCGGSIKVPRFEVQPDGTRQRVMVTDAQGVETPAWDQRNKFLNAQNLIQLAKDTSFTAIMAVGITFVIIAGGIDLSVGALYALASVLGALALHALGPDGSYPATPPWLAVLCGVGICVLVGMAGGLANGGMMVLLRVHPFIITLGTMAVYRGIAFVATGGQSIGGFPAALRDLARWEVGGLSLGPLALLLVVTLVGAVLLARSATGRRIYAVGGNELAARYSGVRVERIKLGVFIGAGLTAGLAAALALGYYGAASSSDGQGYELNVIAAAVVGGASLSGGKGTILGAVLGAVIIQLIASGIVILGIDQNYSQIIVGAVVIVAVVLDRLQQWWAARRLLRATAST